MYGEYTDVEYDHRESDEEIIEIMEVDFNYNMVKRENMQLFDYIQGDVGIERKTTADFIQSYKGDHMWSQCNRMVSQNEYKPYLMIIGTREDIKEYYRKLSKRKEQVIEPDFDSYYAAIGSIAARYGFSVLMPPDEERFCFLMAKIFHSHRHGKAGQIRPLTVTPATKYSVPAQMLALVPGIDMRAVDIADELELTLPREIFSLSYDELIKVKGIGKKKAEVIIDFFGI